MEANVYIKYVRVSPKKLRLLTQSVRKMTPAQALRVLLYSPQRSAKILRKAIKSAVDNAVQTLKREADMLKFQLLTVEEGARLKRFRSGGRGTAKPYKRRTAHIKIRLTENKPD